MKIISFTMVNNEAEIIESFIRYNSNFVDEMVIIDNGCTDNTIPIVRNLKEEGYKITVYDESLEAYNQFRLDNKYLDLIIKEKKPDIIIPLDADEFLTADKNPREALESLSLDRIYYIHWQWYVMTEKDDQSIGFVPQKMKHCLKEAPWNYSDGTPVTKVIIPAKYYREKKLTMTMGHHSVYGNSNITVDEIDHIKLAHYRSISELQLVSKTSCYTVRDISTLENNFETAQRTNQMSIIEKGTDMHDATITASFGGYESAEVIEKPIDLSYCDEKTTKIKYQELSNVPLWVLNRNTGCEMALKYYNLERKNRERKLLKPIILWMDGVRGKECIFPDPGNLSTFIVAKANVRAYLTLTEEIKFLKANYRIILTPDWVKFVPYQYIVVPDQAQLESVKESLRAYNIPEEIIVSWSQYLKKIGILKRIWCQIGVISGMLKRVRDYLKRNGIKTTVSKIKERLKRGK